MHSSPSQQTIHLEDFQHSHEMDARISSHSDEDYDSPPVNSISDGFGLSSAKTATIFISVVFVILTHRKSEFDCIFPVLSND